VQPQLNDIYKVRDTGSPVIGVIQHGLKPQSVDINASRQGGDGDHSDVTPTISDKGVAKNVLMGGQGGL